MVLRKAGWLADQIQRIQVYWDLLPDGVKKSLWGFVSTLAIVFGTWVAGKLTTATPFQIYVGMVMTGCTFAIAYALVTLARWRRPVEVERPPEIIVEARGDSVAALIVRNVGGTGKFTGEGESAPTISHYVGAASNGSRQTLTISVLVTTEPS